MEKDGISRAGVLPGVGLNVPLSRFMSAMDEELAALPASAARKAA
jgi:hypothetical protein